MIEVEVDISNGLPVLDIVGLPDSAVREARERVRAAVKNNGAGFPLQRITVNLAPADMKEEGSGFDLSIALGMMAASGQTELPLASETLLIGKSWRWTAVCVP
jgi:magnesium chelatase family protein